MPGSVTDSVYRTLRIPSEGIRMPRHAWNKSSLDVKRRYFELIRQGLSGSAASQKVGVSLSCGSLRFIDAGSVDIVEKPINSRYSTQDDRIEIAEGLVARESIKAIAERIGKSYQSVYREVARNSKPDGSYQPWFAHNQAHLRRRRPKARLLDIDNGLRAAVAGKLGSGGHRLRSTGGCGVAGPGERRGISVSRRSTRRRIGDCSA